MAINIFFHYLHYRYFECNYGWTIVPLDRCFGAFSNGTPEVPTRRRGKRRMPEEVKGLVKAPFLMRSRI